ncbi:MAG: hypothetical protein PHI35_01810 [Victivallaceae bacterium]|nr:hypothetical protein [Victivallaceae bacterium]
MNRSILIVICDFLVSSMLCMMTGMAPGSTGVVGSRGGGAPGFGLDAATTLTLVNELHNREALLEQLRSRLAAAQKKTADPGRAELMDKVAGELATTRTRAAELERVLSAKRATTGELTPAQLKQQLQEEKLRYTTTQIRLDDARALLDDSESSRKRISGRLDELRGEYMAASRRLDQINTRLASTQKTLSEREYTLKSVGAELDKAKSELDLRERALAEARRISGAERNRAEGMERDISFLRGKLSVVERDLAESRDRIDVYKREATAREIERNEARRQLTDTKVMLKDAVGELSKVRGELVKTKVEITDVKVSAARSEEKLAAAREQLRFDIFERYAAAALKLNIEVIENGLIFDHKATTEFCLPLVELDGRPVVIGDFHMMAGDADTPLSFKQVKSLNYALRLPEGASAVTRIKEKMMLFADEPRMAALEAATVPDRKPLPTISREELLKRGVGDLFLFKSSSFGRESAQLDGRCSIDFANGGKYLFIRNGSRGGTELRAETGDSVVTKEGRFVGVVIGVESENMGRRQTARCYVVGDKFKWDDQLSIPLAKPMRQPYYDEFTSGVRRNLDRIAR